MLVWNARGHLWIHKFNFFSPQDEKQKFGRELPEYCYNPDPIFCAFHSYKEVIPISYFQIILDYNHFLFLNQSTIDTTIKIITPQVMGYAYSYFSSGMCSKFIPYTPTIKVMGINIEVMMVRNSMTLLVLRLIIDKYISL